MSLAEKQTGQPECVVLAELTSGPGFSVDPIGRFLRAYRRKADAIPADLDFAVVALLQNPGGIHDFDMFARILKRAAKIGPDWERFKENLHWPAKEAFYLYDEFGAQARLSTPYAAFKKRFFDFSPRAFLDPDRTGFRVLRKTMAILGAEAGRGAICKLFNGGEKWFKYLLFEREECGDRFVPEDCGLCTIGGCEKGMDNAPCGDATAVGRYDNNLGQVCVGERIYEAAASEDEDGGGEAAGLPKVERADVNVYGPS